MSIPALDDRILDPILHGTGPQAAGQAPGTTPEAGHPASVAAAPPTVSILVGPLGQGGIGTIVVEHCERFAALGMPVDLLLLDAASPFLERLPAAVRRVRLASLHPLWGVIPLARYLRGARPSAVLNHRPRLIRPFLAACALAGRRPRLVTAIHNHLSAQMAGDPGARRRRAISDLRRCDGLVANSVAVAEDAARLIGWPAARIPVAYPPLDGARLLARAAEPPAAPGLDRPPPRYLVAVGRLEAQKDFATLLTAFARLADARPGLELVLLGSGSELPALTALAGRLGVGSRVHFAGFVANPYPWIAGAQALVLSSVHEGFGIVLAEALALGVPVVATDCPSGPAEILEGGRHGRLVPPRDPAALAEAVAATLDEPPDRAALMAAARRFDGEASFRVFLDALGLDGVAAAVPGGS